MSDLIQDMTIPARDGYPLGATVYHAEGDNPVVVIIGSAAAVQRGYYTKFATFLSEHGFTVITFDYRGIGDSRPKNIRNFGKMSHWGSEDVAGVIAWAKSQLSPMKLFYIGQSSGGQVIGLAHNNTEVDALYLVAAQSGNWMKWDGFYRLIMLFLWYVLIPTTTTILGYVPGRLMGSSESWPGGIIAEWAHWGRHPDYMVGRIPEAKAGFERIQVPIMVLGFSDDVQYPPKRAVDALYDWYTSPYKERKQISPSDIGEKSIGHFGFFRSRFQDTLWQDALIWLKGKL